MIHVETHTTVLRQPMARVLVHLWTEKFKWGINHILMLRGLEPKTRVRSRDDDCPPRETGCRHGRHLEDLAVQELIDFA